MKLRPQRQEDMEIKPLLKSVNIDSALSSMNTDADKEAKEKMIMEMCEDCGFDPSWLAASRAEQIFDTLIRKGYRKIKNQ